MLVESFEREMKKTCKRCYTIFDLKRDYCCLKSRWECFADLGLVRRGIRQDPNMAEKLYRNLRIDKEGKILNPSFFRGWLVN